MVALVFLPSTFSAMSVDDSTLAVLLAEPCRSRAATLNEAARTKAKAVRYMGDSGWFAGRGELGAIIRTPTGPAGSDQFVLLPRNCVTLAFHSAGCFGRYGSWASPGKVNCSLRTCRFS